MSPGDVVTIQPGTVALIFAIKRHNYFEESFGVVWACEPLLLLTNAFWACEVMMSDGKTGWLLTSHFEPPCQP